MKKLTAFIFILLSALLAFPDNTPICRAIADGGYARIDCDGAELFADASLTLPVFTLPKTYYVCVKEVGAEKTRVSFMGGADGAPTIEGYVKTVNLSFSESAPSAPYPEAELILRADEVMFSDVSAKTPKCVLNKGSLARFYGETVFSGETYVYVYAKNNVGYVKKTSFEEYDIPYHPDYVKETAASYNESGETSSGEDSSPSKEEKTTEPSTVIIIALLIIGVLCVLFLIVKKEDKRTSSGAFFRDDD